jgi:peptide/nickel transport system substrate-binding protein
VNGLIGIPGSGRPRRVVEALAIFALLLSACAPLAPVSDRSSGQVQQSAQREAPRTLITVARVEVASLAAKPPQSAGATAFTSVRLFNADLAIEDHRGVAQPYLAESLPQLNSEAWRVFPDGRMETTYTLRPNLTWHDGTPLSAEDFVFAWRVYLAPELGFATAPPNHLIEDVQTPDARTLVLRWAGPYPDAAVLGTPGNLFPPLPRHILAQPFRDSPIETFAAHPFWSTEYIGLGPYRLDRWERGSFVEGSAFSGHVLGQPKIERIRMLYIGDANAVVANLLAGEVHMSVDSAISYEEGAIVKQEWAPRNVGSVLLSPGLWHWVQIQQRPELASPLALRDARVRKALAYGVDKSGVSEVSFAGEGIHSDSPIKPTDELFGVIDRAVVKYPYDPRRAEQLMGEAGFTRGPDGIFRSATGERFRTDLATFSSVRSDSERSVLAAIWRQAGFDVTEEANWPPAVSRDAQLRNTHPGLSRTGGNSGPQALTDHQSSRLPRPENRWSGSNRGGWSSLEFDRAIDGYLTTLDRSERNRHLAEAARIFTEDAGVIPLYFNLITNAVVTGLNGPRIVAAEGAVAWDIHTWEWQ